MKGTKRFVTLAVALMLMAQTSFVYAEGISVEYVDLLIERMSGKTDKEISNEASNIKAVLITDEMIDLYKSTYVENLSDSQLKKLNDAGLTKQDVIDNLDALKTWSKEDRYALVDYTKTGDASSIKELNDKYSEAKGTSNASGAAGGNLNQPNPVETNQVVSNETVLSNRSAVIKKPINIKTGFEDKTFTDVSSHWSKDYVEFFARRGIVGGREDGKFYPDDKITRAEIIKIVSNVIFDDINSLKVVEVGYKDVYAYDWFYPYVQNMTSLGVISNEGELAPNVQPTREEIIDLMIKTLLSAGIEVSDTDRILPAGYKDEDKIKDSYKESMAIAVNLGIIKGIGNGYLDPNSEVTRAQVMAMTKNLYDNILKTLNEGVNN